MKGRLFNVASRPAPEAAPQLAEALHSLIEDTWLWLRALLYWLAPQDFPLPAGLDADEVRARADLVGQMNKDNRLAALSEEFRRSIDLLEEGILRVAAGLGSAALASLHRWSSDLELWQSRNQETLEAAQEGLFQVEISADPKVRQEVTGWFDQDEVECFHDEGFCLLARLRTMFSLPDRPNAEPSVGVSRPSEYARSTLGGASRRQIISEPDPRAVLADIENFVWLGRSSDAWVDWQLYGGLFSSPDEPAAVAKLPLLEAAMLRRRAVKEGHSLARWSALASGERERRRRAQRRCAAYLLLSATHWFHMDAGALADFVADDDVGDHTVMPLLEQMGNRAARMLVLQGLAPWPEPEKIHRGASDLILKDLTLFLDGVPRSVWRARGQQDILRDGWGLLVDRYAAQLDRHGLNGDLLRRLVAVNDHALCLEVLSELIRYRSRLLIERGLVDAPVQPDSVDTLMSRWSGHGSAVTDTAGRRASLDAGRPDDGPRASNRFRWMGKETELQPKPWAVLDYLWSNHRAAIQDVEGSVWGETLEGDAALKTAITKANRALMELGCPLQIHRSGSLLTLE